MPGRSVLLLLGLLLAIAPARAQERVARIIGGFAAGGTSDIVARLVADSAGPLLGLRVVVENRTGASGMIGAEFVARSAPDGLTLYQCASLVTVLPELPGMRLPIDPMADLAPVANVAHSSQAMVVKADAPWQSLADFLAAARAAPGRLTYASAGIGALSHLSGARLAQLARIDITHVPYRGAALGVVDVMAGRASTIITNLGDVVRQVQGGELRLLGFADGLGSPLFPQAPLLSATVPGYEISGWFGICGPRAMAPEMIERWQAAIAQALQQDAVRRRLLDNGLTPRFEDPAAFARTMQADRAVWRDTIRAADIRAE